MSVENINPYNKYQGNGVATEFSVDFPYNNKTDVVVYLKNEGEAQQTLVVNTDYTWLNDTTIQTTTAPADGSILAIYRETPAASDYNFENQRRLFPAEVTNSDNLAILLIQELKAMFSRTLTVDETSTVTPEELVDELNSLVATAAGYVSQCSGYSDLAQAWATKTDGPVSGGEYSSKYYAEQILPMADDINTVATNISDINTAAANITDIQNASANALLAKNWAIKTDGVVEGSDYSAKYNAGLAATSASNASISETNAANSAELAAQYGNDKINQTHISNCITYIPQDIKLELDNGTLTLKAGSKVYVPNGAGVFDVVTVPSDVIFHTGTIGSASGSFILFCNSSGGFGIRAGITTCASGPTNPGSGYSVWYDTTDNKIKYSANADGNFDDGGYSLPVGTYTRTNGIATSIERIFNSSGRIGSTTFILPSVKGLIPNGRNEDGTLKSIEFTVDNVKTRTFSWDISGSGQYLFIGEGGNINSSGTNIPFYQQEDTPPAISYAYWYKPSENIMYTTGSGTTWNKVNYMMFGQVIGDNTGKITFFKSKPVFHSVDYDKMFIGHQAMPSDKYISLTLGATESTYVAPADGYFVISKKGNQGNYFYATNNNNNISTLASYPSNDFSCHLWLPFKKGQVLFVSYNASGTTNRFYFVYAEGEV